MTLREAMAQSARELGDSEESIQAGLRFADINTPEGSVVSLREITPGEERKIIDAMKAERERLTANPVAKMELMRRVVGRMTKQQQNQ